MSKNLIIKLTGEQEQHLKVRAGQEGVYLNIPWSSKKVLLREDVAEKLKTDLDLVILTHKKIKALIEEDLEKLRVLENVRNSSTVREELIRHGITDILMSDPCFNCDVTFWTNQYYETVVAKGTFLNEMFEDPWNSLANLAWDLYGIQDYDWRVAHSFEFTHEYCVDTGITTRSMCLKVPYNGSEAIESELEIALVFDHEFENNVITVCYREKRTAE